MTLIQCDKHQQQISTEYFFFVSLNLHYINYEFILSMLTVKKIKMKEIRLL